MLSEGSPLIHEIANGTSAAVSNPYILTLISTFVATVAATAIVFLVEWQREQIKILAELNSARAILCSHMNHILTLKARYALPHFRQIAVNRERVKSSLSNGREGDEHRVIILEARDCLITLSHTPLKFYVPIEYISKHADKDVHTLSLLMAARQSIDSVASLVETRNQILDDIRNEKNDAARYARILGLPLTSAPVDTRLYDVIEALVESSDYALFYLHETMRRIESLAGKVLPLGFSEKVKPFKFVDSELSMFMPDIDEFRKKVFGNMPL